MSHELLSGLLQVLSFQRQGDCDWAGNFLVCLARADNFEMTLMFMGDNDLANLEKILKNQKISQKIRDSIAKKYK